MVAANLFMSTWIPLNRAA